MRTALCISGLPRHVEKAFPNIKANLIDPNQPDIFIHTWMWVPGIESLSFYEAVKRTGHIRRLVCSHYNPVDSDFVNQIPFANYAWPLDRMLEPTAGYARSYTRENFITMLYSSWYSVQQANLLKELYQRRHGFTYDCIIRARFDIDYNMPVVVADRPMDKIYLSNLPRPSEMLCDRFAFGPNDLMNAYASAFNLLDLVLYDMMKMYNIPAETIPELVCGHVH